jgi:hypothetical protein
MAAIEYTDGTTATSQAYMEAYALNLMIAKCMKTGMSRMSEGDEDESLMAQTSETEVKKLIASEIANVASGLNKFKNATLSD